MTDPDLTETLELMLISARLKQMLLTRGVKIGRAHV